MAKGGANLCMTNDHKLRSSDTEIAFEEAKDRKLKHQDNNQIIIPINSLPIPFQDHT